LFLEVLFPAILCDIVNYRELFKSQENWLFYTDENILYTHFMKSQNFGLYHN